MGKNSIKFDIDFTSNFDPSQIVEGLKAIRKQMGDLSLNQSIFKGVDKELVALQKQITELQAKSKNMSSGSDFNAYNNQLMKVRDTAIRVGEGLNQIATNEDKSFKFKTIGQYKDQILELNKALSETQEKLTKIQKQIGEKFQLFGFDNEDIQKMMGQLNDTDVSKKLKDKLTQQSRRLDTKFFAAQNEMLSVYDTERVQLPNFKYDYISKEGMSKQNATVNARAEIKKQIVTLLSTGTELNQAVKTIKDSLQALGYTLTDEDKITKIIGNTYKNRQEQITNAQKSRDIVEGQQKMIQRDIYDSKSPSSLSSQIEQYSNYTNQIKQTEEQIKNLNAEQEKINNQNLKDLGEKAIQAGDNVKQLTEAETNVSKAQQEVIQKQNEVNKVFDRIGLIVRNVLSLGNAWRKANQYIRQTFKDIERLDKAFASIAMVTKYSVEDLWGQYSQYSEIANRLGQTTEGAIKSSALFYQQGLDTNEVLSLTEDTLKMATLAGEDYTTATKQMTAALRGFSMEMEEGSRVTDVYSELAANAAADVKGIAYAMSKTSSIAASAGMGFETTAAFITNMIETTQEAPTISER